LREALTETVVRAREARLGVWAEDRTNAGSEVEGLDSITEEHVILPKLFRRLAEYLQAGGSVAGQRRTGVKKGIRKGRGCYAPTLYRTTTFDVVQFPHFLTLDIARAPLRESERNPAQPLDESRLKEP
jgi:hypothetical protein